MSDDRRDRIVSELLARERALMQERERHAALQTAIDRLRATLQSLGDGDTPRIGDLRRTSPVSDVWGTDRGLPVDRHYIAAFLDRYRSDIRGRVLEVKDPGYTHAFGDGAVTSVDIVDVDAANRQATIIADLRQADGIPSNTYDCIILTQTLPFIYDVRAAVRGTRRVLKPGGVLLATVPGISQISREDMRDWGDWWRFTSASAKRLFEEEYGAENVETEVHGNLVAACALLYGLAQEELKREDLERYCVHRGEASA